MNNWDTYSKPKQVGDMWEVYQNADSEGPKNTFQFPTEQQGKDFIFQKILDSVGPKKKGKK